MERKTIINEVFEETFERLDDSVDMKIETLNRNDKVPVDCPKCNRALDKIYCRFEDSEIDDGDFDLIVFDLIVFKCRECKTVYAYWIDNSYTDIWLAGQMETPMPTKNQPLGSKMKPIPKECAVEYAKAISAQDAKNKELNRLIQGKLPELCKAGLSLETINFARNKAVSHLKTKKLSPKSLIKLVAAAIYITANGVIMEGSSLWKHQGEGISERQLEDIFGVSRKTIRKWKAVLEKNNSL